MSVLMGHVCFIRRHQRYVLCPCYQYCHFNRQAPPFHGCDHFSLIKQRRLNQLEPPFLTLRNVHNIRLHSLYCRDRASECISSLVKRNQTNYHYSTNSANCRWLLKASLENLQHVSSNNSCSLPVCCVTYIAGRMNMSQSQNLCPSTPCVSVNERTTTRKQYIYDNFGFNMISLQDKKMLSKPCNRRIVLNVQIEINRSSKNCKRYESEEVVGMMDTVRHSEQETSKKQRFILSTKTTSATSLVKR